MLAELQPLIWIIAGFLLIVAELFVSGLVIVFFGTAAIATGLAVWLGMPTANGIPFFVFTILTLGQIYFLRGVFKNWFHGASVQFSAADSAAAADDFAGREADVVSGFGEGERNGRVEFRGTQWTARSEESLNVGDRVTIERREGQTLYVTKTQK